MSDEYVYGASAVVTYHEGVRVRVKLDEPWKANDPFVKARPDLFRGVPEKVQTTDNEKPKRTTRRKS